MSNLALMMNAVIVVATGATIAGLYALGAGGYAFWALALLLALNCKSERA